MARFAARTVSVVKSTSIEVSKRSDLIEMKAHSTQPSPRPGSALLFLGAILAVGAIVHCGGDSSPTPPTSVTTTLAPATTTTTTLASGVVLPPGMVCSPTPPPLYGMQLKIHGGTPGRYVMDSKPIVVNVDNYCDKVVGTSGIYCETRTENDPQRQACDYMVVGKASNGRWGPTWYIDGKLCDGANTDLCKDDTNNQFLAIAKATGKYEACADNAPKLAPDGSRCGLYIIE